MHAKFLSACVPILSNPCTCIFSYMYLLPPLLYSTVSAPVTKAKKPKVAAVDPLSASTVSKPLISKRQAFGSERHSISPPAQASDPDKTFTVDSEKTYSMAFAKRQAKAAAAAVAVQMKRDKTPPQSVDIDPRMSLEGRSLDRDRGDPASSSKEGQVKKKPRKAEAVKGNPKLRSGPLGYELGVERRPSIERGGTNTIEMEVSGIGSRGSSRGKENLAIIQDLPSTSQSQPQPHAATTKENSGGRKRRKHNPIAAGVEETDTAAVAGVVQQSVEQYASSTTKPPVPPASMVQERSTNPSLSAPIKNAQKKVKKSRQHSHHQASSQESGYGTAGDETPSRRTSYSTTVSDTYSSASSGGGGGNGSPGESQLIELQPFSNPEQGLRESIAKIANEDWSAKCDGMIGIRQLAMYHPGVLQPQLHSVVLAVQKEVCCMHNVRRGERGGGIGRGREGVSVVSIYLMGSIFPYYYIIASIYM